MTTHTDICGFESASNHGKQALHVRTRASCLCVVARKLLTGTSLSAALATSYETLEADRARITILYVFSPGLITLVFLLS